MTNKANKKCTTANKRKVSRKRGCSLVWHRAGNIIFCSRPSLTDTPARPPSRPC